MRPLLLPGAAAGILAGYLLIPGVRATPGLFWALAGASAGVLAWTGWLAVSRHRSGDPLEMEFLAIRPHWVQLLAQGTVLAWWGWFVPAVYEFAPFILAQLVLAVALEALFSWTRRGRHTLGFGPVPVVFSLNLFLWFHLDWKRHGQEKLAKSYEEKLKKLEQRLEEETKVRIAIEEQLQASGEQERAKFHDLQTELREKESELAELAKLLRTVQEQLCEQETKREESQRKLELLQKTTALQTSKSQEDLDKYCDSVTKLCEELTDLKKKSEDQQKEIEKLRETLKRAEQIEVEYTEATKKLSEVEAKLKAVESQARLVPPTAGGAEQISDTAGTTAAANAELQAKTATVEKLEKEVDELRAELKARDQEVCELKGKEREISPHTSKEVKKLKREVDELREKLRSRDEELSDLKKGNTPFVDASLSPTDSMTADSSEVVELKLKMRERETELENLQRQVQSMEQALLELNRLRKVSESLKMENEKLLHRSKSVSDHSKRQSEQIMALRKQLETRALPVSTMCSFTG